MGDFFNCILYHFKILTYLSFKICPYSLAFLFKYFVLVMSEIPSFIFLKIVLPEFLLLFIFSVFYKLPFFVVVHLCFHVKGIFLLVGGS